MRRSQRGNAVVFVLLAIALFAALAYTFMRGAKSGQGNLTAGQVKIKAQEIMNYSSNVEKGVNRLMQRQCSDTGISFDSSQWFGLGTNATYTYTPDVGNECKIFDVQGSGITYEAMPDGASIKKNYQITGQYAVSGIGTDGATSASSELMILARFISRDMCLYINNTLGITNPSGEPPDEWFSIACGGNTPGDACSVTDETFHGNYLSPGPTFTNPSLVGKYAGCLQATGGMSGYVFYQVLIAR